MSPWRELIFALGITLISEFIVHILNPFGIEEAISKRAALVVQKIAAPYYGIHDRAGTAGQQRVTVVLINESVATRPADNTVVWPLPVNTLMNDVVAPVLARKPAAVFIDLAFPNAPREVTPDSNVSVNASRDKLVAELAKIDGGDVPVFVSDVFVESPDARCKNGLRLGLMADAARASTFKGAGKIALVDSLVETKTGGYLLTPAAISCDPNAETRGDTAAPRIASPALALLTAYCRDGLHADLCGQPRMRALLSRIHTGPRRPDGLQPITVTPALPHVFAMTPDAADEAIDLRWGTRLSPLTIAAYANLPDAASCAAQFKANPFEPLMLFASMFSGSIERRTEASMFRPCTYIDTIGADRLDKTIPDWRAHRERAPGSLTPRLNIGNLFLRDRIVLIGVDLVQAGDKYQSPVNGVIPGVYIHAAAVENLLTRGDSFPRSEPSPLWWAAVVVISTLLVFIMRRLWDWLCSKLVDTLPPLGELLIAPMLYIGAVLILGGIVIALLSQTPLPMAEIALPIATLHLALFAKLVERFEHRLSHSLGIAHRD